MNAEPAPPSYTIHEPGQNDTLDQTPPQDPWIFIVPAADAVQFQKGYLGVTGERAAIEGEIQVKSVNASRWKSLTLTLRATESDDHRIIELSSATVEVFKCAETSASSTQTILPSSCPFSIPLTSDMPQSVSTPKSSISYQLTAELCPWASSESPLSTSVPVFIRRFADSNSPELIVDPISKTVNEPTAMQVQIPRSKYRVGELIPIYVTIPSPARSLVTERRLMLRSVRIELVRVITLSSDLVSGKSAGAINQDSSSSSNGLPDNNTFETVLSRTGAACRFHPTKAIRLRLVLRPGMSSDSPSTAPSELPDSDIMQPEADTIHASISQSTLLHHVTFMLRVRFTYLDGTNHTEHQTITLFPLTFLPTPAPLPQVDESMDAAYRKKYDRTPLKTVRYDTVDAQEGEAGPSAAPPPFEEVDAPPPFSIPESASTSRLPSFLESESQLTGIVTSLSDHPAAPTPFTQALSDPVFPGEGADYGFSPSQHFDGLSSPVTEVLPLPDLSNLQSPPSMTSAVQSAPVYQGLLLPPGLEPPVHLSSQVPPSSLVEDPPPPPPPALDDPLDPPPTIDSEFRPGTAQSDTATSQLDVSPLIIPAGRINEPPSVAAGFAPPPYPVSATRQSREHDLPPYVN